MPKPNYYRLKEGKGIQKVESDYSRLRSTVRELKLNKDNKKFFFQGEGHEEKNMVGNLYDINQQIRDRDYQTAFGNLKTSYSDSKFLPIEIKSRYQDAIVRRLRRVHDHVMRDYKLGQDNRDLEIAKRSAQLADKIASRSVDKSGGLERTSGIVSIVLLIGSIFFLSSNLTGYSINNLTDTSPNSIGLILFIVGLAGTFFYLKEKSK